MNKERRKQIDLVSSRVDEIRSELDRIKDEMKEHASGPSFEDENFSNAIDRIDLAISELEECNEKLMEASF